MTFKVHNALALLALVVLLLVAWVGGCPFAWALFGWLSGAAMALWSMAKLGRLASNWIA